MRSSLWFVFVLMLVAPRYVSGQSACSSPAPPPGLDPVAQGQRAQVLAYAGSLTFHPATHPTGETRRLTEIATPGPVSDRRFRLSVEGAVAPERCAHMNTAADLGPGAGRIVSRQTMAGPYDKLSLPAGVSYLWVDNLTGTEARGVIIPEDASLPARVVAIRIEPHPAGLPRRAFAEARWMFDPDDDWIWVACEQEGCCWVYIPGGE